MENLLNSKEMRGLHATLDDGPDTSSLSDVFSKWEKLKGLEATERMKLMLVWADTDKSRRLATKLNQIVDEINAAENKEAMKRLRVLTFARFVHQSNSIEGEGPRSLDGTTTIICDMLDRGDDPEQQTMGDRTHAENVKCVWNMYKLLVQTFKLKTLARTLPLQQYHKDLFAGDPPNSIRNCGVMSRAGHKYPHHNLVPGLLSHLQAMYPDFSTGLEGVVDPVERIIYAFAIAAFTHFHFVSIHPFVDGNGRLARIVSKLILDAVLPAPFPFDNPRKYIETLSSAADQPGFHQPLGLFNYMLKEGHDYFVNELGVKVRKLSDLINHPEKRRYVLPVSNERTLQEELNKEVEDDAVRTAVWPQLQLLFQDLRQKGSRRGEVQTDNGVFIITRLTDTDGLGIDFDDI